MYKVDFSEILANRIRERLNGLPNVKEKVMMGGLVFMVNDKMCIGVIKDEMMCRIDRSFHETATEMRSCRTMDFTKRPMIGYVLIDETGMKTNAEFDYWINLCLDFNKYAKASKKKRRT